MLIQFEQFLVRSDKIQQDTISTLSMLLVSIRGRRLLSVLIDNTNMMPPVDSFLTTHAHTLRVLVWEGRKAARTRWGSDTSLLDVGWIDEDG